jgi:hypothetical protein
MITNLKAPGPVRMGLISVAGIALTLLSGCAAQTQMTNVWRDSALAPASLDNVLVVAVRKDPVRRRTWEDAFVAALAKRGVTATASYRLSPDAVPDTADVIAAVREHRYAAVLTSARLPDQTESTYVPGAFHAEEVMSRDYYGRFHSRWVTVGEPGYTETDTVVRVQTDVWSTAPGNGRLVWSGTLRTLESMSGGTVEKAVTRFIMPEMDQQGVFPSKPR